MLGSEAKHSIENIAVYIVDASTKEVEYTKDITNWQSNSSEYDNGRTTDFVLETKLDDGNYRIFAVGYHSDSSYSGNDIKSALVSGSTFNENAVLSLSTDGGAEEIFAGSTESIPVEKSKGFKQKVILNRQVAGVYVYAKDVPYIADATQLRLVGSNEHNRLVLGQFRQHRPAEQRYRQQRRKGRDQRFHRVVGIRQDSPDHRPQRLVLVNRGVGQSYKCRTLEETRKVQRQGHLREGCSLRRRVHHTLRQDRIGADAQAAAYDRRRRGETRVERQPALEPDVNHLYALHVGQRLVGLHPTGVVTGGCQRIQHCT